MSLTHIQKAYKRWAPHYDFSFGLISEYGRNYVVSEINKTPCNVLEVGVGTGLSLPLYAPDVQITGIDISDIMLAKARKRVKKHHLKNVTSLERMDATNLAYPDNHFDKAAAMFIMSVAPNPEKIMQEMIRVIKSGGDIYIINHFQSHQKTMSTIEKYTAPLCRFIGWNSEFSMKRLLNIKGVELVDTQYMRPMKLFQMLHFKKI